MKKRDIDDYFLMDKEVPDRGKKFDERQLDIMADEAVRMAAPRDRTKEKREAPRHEKHEKQDDVRTKPSAFTPSLDDDDDDLLLPPRERRQKRELKEENVIRHTAEVRPFDGADELEPMPVRRRVRHEEEAGEGGEARVRRRSRLAEEGERKVHRTGPKPPLPVWRLIGIDLLCFTIALFAFAYFHHVNTFENIFGLYPTPIVLPTPTPTATPAPTTTPALSPGQSAQPSPAQTPVQTPTQPVSLREKFAAKFTKGDVVKTENSYKSANISVELKKVSENGIVYFVADIYVADISYFKTALAGGKMGGGTSFVPELAKQNKAIIAINGDQYGGHPYGIVLRNGTLYREVPFEDVLLMQHDGTMQTFYKSDFDLNAVKTTGAYQIWSFGPMLLKDGQPMTTFNSTVKVANPRSAIGYYEPGHYCFVTVDGRRPDTYSKGMTLTELSKLFYDLGCKVAYNLDGGDTAAMAFDGKYANDPSGDRAVTDIIYIAEQ